MWAEFDGFSTFGIFGLVQDVVEDEEGLPTTGSNVNWLLFIGVLLIVGGVIIYNRYAI